MLIHGYTHTQTHFLNQRVWNTGFLLIRLTWNVLLQTTSELQCGPPHPSQSCYGVVKGLPSEAS